jgi:hypothetical protein
MARLEKMGRHKTLSFQALEDAARIPDGRLSGGIPANAPGS